MRTVDVLNGDSVEHLVTLGERPVCIGVVDNDEGSVKCDQIWDISNYGLIQLRNPQPLDVVYQRHHNDSIGELWTEHFIALSEFISQYDHSNVYEIGGGQGALVF